MWLAWTENLTKREAQKLKDAKKKVIAKLQAMVGLSGDARFKNCQSTFAAVDGVLGFSRDEDDTGSGRIADAMEYLKLRGRDAGDLRYLEPGDEPFDLPDLDVRVYVLGPPKAPAYLKTSAPTEAMKRDGVIYHLAATGDAGIEALSAAVSSTPGAQSDRYHPFSTEHRIAPVVQDAISKGLRPNAYYEQIRPFVESTYDDPTQAWRRIDDDWLNAFGQLALDLDNDTNNTSLVLAFEFKKTREVLLFVADAQIGSWLSWAELDFKVEGQTRPVKAVDLLSRTVFYKVGHHCSHNATAKSGGLELMSREDLVAFIPLDKDTAAKQGTKGWQMPAAPLFKALKAKTASRVVISDVKETPPREALNAGVVATQTYVDYFLE